MEQNEIKFIVDYEAEEVKVSGFSELEGRGGLYVGDDMAMFWGEGWRNHELFIANTQTGKIRKLSTEGGTMLVDDSEIDFKSIREFGIILKQNQLFCMFNGISLQCFGLIVIKAICCQCRNKIH